MGAPSIQTRIANLAGCLIAAGVLVSLAADALYRSRLYQRGSFTLAQVRLEADARSVSPWPVDGTGYRGFVRPSSAPHPKGTIVIFHGNAGLALHRTHYISALEPLGYRVVLAEYPGYGGRPGGVFEQTLIRDAAETAEAARKAFGEPLFIWGESMGCAVAAAVAGRLKQHVQGLVLITPWENLPALTEHLYPYNPVRLFIRERFDTATGLADYGGPTAFMVAARDKTVPPWHSLRLFAGYQGPKKLWHFPTAGHTTWPTGPASPWWSAVMQYHEGRPPLAMQKPRHEDGKGIE